MPSKIFSNSRFTDHLATINPLADTSSLNSAILKDLQELLMTLGNERFYTKDQKNSFLFAVRNPTMIARKEIAQMIPVFADIVWEDPSNPYAAKMAFVKFMQLKENLNPQSLDYKLITGLCKGFIEPSFQNGLEPDEFLLTNLYERFCDDLANAEIFDPVRRQVNWDRLRNNLNDSNACA